MKRRMGRVLALLLTAGMLGTSPAMQVLAEEPAEKTDITVDVMTEERTDKVQIESSVDDAAAGNDENSTDDAAVGNDENGAGDAAAENDENGTGDATVDNDMSGVEDTETGVFGEDHSKDVGEGADTDEADEETLAEENSIVVAAEPDISSFAVSGNLFDDVSDDSWYLPYVTYTLNKGVMTGKGNNVFAPGETLARAQFAVVLWRISGAPGAAYIGTYPDVPNGQFYTSAVEWASAKDVGVIGGYENGNFGPNDNITREQLVTMLYRYAKYRNLDMTHTNNLKEFPDAGNVTEFALEAMKWAVGSGIITGDKGNLNPQGNTNRAECAAMLQRFCETYMSGELQNIEISANCGNTDISVTDQQKGEFWLKAEGVQGAPGVQTVQARVWCDDYWGDAYFYNLEKQSDGSWGTAGLVRNHANHVGTYQMQMYVLLDIGVRIPVGDVQTAEIEGTPGYFQVMSHVQKIYDQVGYDLLACYQWCINNISYRTLPIPLYPAEGYTAPEWYAMQAFQYGSGNCYVYAAVFYYCALGLGYDAEYIEGKVPLRSGGYGPHGWVIINQNGGSYICDPEFQYESGYNCWMQPLNSTIITYIW